jgi:hypothetical protein
MEKLNSKLRNFLIEYDCKTDLFDYILICKDKLLKKIPKYFIEPVKIETSIKKMNDGNIIKGRYVLALSLAEFNKYDDIDKNKIFSIVGFDINKFKKYLQYKSINDTIYIGFDNEKGKIYFEESLGDIIAFETTGLIKYYKSHDCGNAFDVTTSISKDKIVGQHFRMHTKYGMNWISINDNYTTIYFRQDINPDSNDDFMSLPLDLKYKYSFLSYWFKHNTMSFYTKYNNLRQIE